MTTIFFKLQSFNSSKTLGRDSDSFFAGITKVMSFINKFRNKDRSFLAITHYQRLLDYMHPDYIHVLIDGKIMKSGDISLAHKLEEKGYSWLES